MSWVRNCKGQVKSSDRYRGSKGHHNRMSWVRNCKGQVKSSDRHGCVMCFLELEKSDLDVSVMFGMGNFFK